MHIIDEKTGQNIKNKLYVRYVVTFMKAKKLRHSAHSARLRLQSSRNW